MLVRRLSIPHSKISRVNDCHRTIRKRHRAYKKHINRIRVNLCLPSRRPERAYSFTSIPLRRHALICHYLVVKGVAGRAPRVRPSTPPPAARPRRLHRRLSEHVGDRKRRPIDNTSYVNAIL
ncbi:hypothetical protein EVAR_88509_1 [Eumeta japonica]|uniref:Uncharacterized protein n=1 Tax=Eumeta variegata TaxID=151549 RepID=A0A4C1XVW8_EUMVA|nr:hypothetical protein EVAR_88509_1 [Eumeta japonica]